MKKLFLCLSLAAFAATSTAVIADSYDSDQATIKKASDSTAKVTIGSKTYTTPISFDDGASWDVVKDHYEVSSAAEDWLKAGKACISIGSDGTASFKPKKK
ncbi:MAG: hypothetical protein LV479_10400 [Methylacidiphilales bacterium]|nr:hypothetical protein [Candidatus Methylacidiphilales bacterium]